MKTILSLSALIITLTLTAQSNTATWYLNDTSGDGIQAQGGTASGISSFAMGSLSEASGEYSTAMGLTATASGDYSTSIGVNVASGFGSTAMGVDTRASGEISTAMGDRTEASGEASTAMGQWSTASGGYSTAMGSGTTASGIFSTAMGWGTIASDNSSLVIGQFNLLGSTVTNSATDFSKENTAFVIGNGTYLGPGQFIRSDALTVLFDGTTNVAGSVTATEFIGDGSQLTNLPSISPFSFNDESGGTGLETYTNTASGGKSSFAVGNHNVASGVSSTAMGADTTASGDYSTAMGYGATASGNSSFAVGSLSEASGEYSTAMGQWSTASGDYSTAMGYGATASDMSSLVVGQYNLLGSTVTNSATEFSTENTAFVIGNGADADNRSDALTVLFDGTTTIAGDLSINSDARLKANIISLGSTLAKLLQIDGKSYTMKKDENKKQKIGVLAQDIEKVFPELVSESNGVKSVNYQGLVPVLINALKEQDNKMNEQEARIERLEKLLLNS